MPPSPEVRVSPIQIMAPRSPAVLSPMQRRMAPTKSLQHLKRTPLHRCSNRCNKARCKQLHGRDE